MNGVRRPAGRSGYRRLGVASEFNRYHVQLVKRLGGKIVRYMTGGGNLGSQTIGARWASSYSYLHRTSGRSIR